MTDDLASADWWGLAAILVPSLVWVWAERRARRKGESLAYRLGLNDGLWAAPKKRAERPGAGDAGRGGS